MNKSTLVVVGLIVVVMGGLIINANIKPLEVENTVQTVEEPSVVDEEVLEVDVVEQAKTELDRINAELDAEETRLLEEKAQVEAKAAADVAELESRLEKIRDTRTSF